MKNTHNNKKRIGRLQTALISLVLGVCLLVGMSPAYASGTESVTVQSTSSSSTMMEETTDEDATDSATDTTTIEETTTTTDDSSNAEETTAEGSDAASDSSASVDASDVTVSGAESSSESSDASSETETVQSSSTSEEDEETDAVVSGSVGASLLAAAQTTSTDLGELQASKTLTDNGDGTYDITLSVTGKVKENTTASKMNVVIVFDKSYSMNNSVTLSDGSSSTRLAEAKKAAESLVESLSKLNATYKDTVEMACVEFSGTASMTDHNGTSIYSDVENSSATLSALKNEIDSIKTVETNEDDVEAGTNWEAGLNLANSVSFGDERADVPTYVIFITDGDPTLRTSQNGQYDFTPKTGGYFKQEETYPDYSGFEGDDRFESSGIWGTGISDSYYFRRVYSQGSLIEEEYDHLNKHAAEVEARKIVNAGKEFYAIRIFNTEASEQRLKDVVIYAYDNDEKEVEDNDPPKVSLDGSDSHYYNAQDSAKLSEALTNIGSIITNSSAFKEVKVYDTLTGLTDADIRTDSSQFTYTKTDANGNTVTWDNPPAASISTDGKVTWDLGKNELENGVTYSVTFRVWPDQQALDCVAQLNNASADEAEALWNSISESHPEIVREQQTDGSYHYKLKTNKDKSDTNPDDGPYVTYTHVDKTIPGGSNETPNQRVDLTNPDPIPLWDAEMTIEKLWKDSSGQDLSTDNIDHITAVIKDHDNTNNTDTNYLTVNITKGTDGTWKSEIIHLAVGLVDKYASDGSVRGTDNRKNAQGTVLEQGHVYSVSEATVYYTDNTSQSVDAAGFSFSVDGTVHPMLDDWEKTSTDGTYDLNDYTVVYDGNPDQTFTITNKKNEPETKTTDIKLKKIDSKTWNGLSGAGFSLFKANDDWTQNGDAIKTFTSGTDGTFTVDGLQAGKYLLKETNTPAGYQEPTHEWRITVSEGDDGLTATVQAYKDGQWTTVDTDTDGNNLIKNVPVDYNLPSTGGLGSLPFVAAGSAILAFAAALYIFITKTKKEGS